MSLFWVPLFWVPLFRVALFWVPLFWVLLFWVLLFWVLLCRVLWFMHEAYRGVFNFLLSVLFKYNLFPTYLQFYASILQFFKGKLVIFNNGFYVLVKICNIMHSFAIVKRRVCNFCSFICNFHHPVCKSIIIACNFMYLVKIMRSWILKKKRNFSQMSKWNFFSN